MLKKIKKTAFRMARPDIMFYCLPWLMFLLVAGTIAQKEIGLYQAEKIFFSSWILWIGYAPLPGGIPTLGIIFLNLAAKFILKSRWEKKRVGTIISHFGILLLFIGAIFTALTTEEGFLLIPENETSHTIYDYHKKAFYIREENGTVYAIPFEDMKDQNHPISIDLPFKITPLSHCINCDVTTRPSSNSSHKGLAKEKQLKPAPLQNDSETNLAGVTFQISHADDDQNGTYISTEAMPSPLIITKDARRFDLRLQRKEASLPFDITLNDFVREQHPGTDMPSHYHSDITLTDGEINWQTRIDMNSPLRYRGYTIFQSSFTDNEQGQASILAVVKNTGWLFPYISSILIALGLILHLIIRLKGRYD